jgi:hypothetical protein
LSAETDKPDYNGHIFHIEFYLSITHSSLYEITLILHLLDNTRNGFTSVHRIVIIYTLCVPVSLLIVRDKLPSLRTAVRAEKAGNTHSSSIL